MCVHPLSINKYPNFQLLIFLSSCRLSNLSSKIGNTGHGNLIHTLYLVSTQETNRVGDIYKHSFQTVGTLQHLLTLELPQLSKLYGANQGTITDLLSNTRFLLLSFQFVVFSFRQGNTDRQNCKKLFSCKMQFCFISMHGRPQLKMKFASLSGLVEWF